MVIDLGTGGGGAVLRAARRDPTALIIGVDTDAAAMRDASRRAAGPTRRGGLPNALFLVGVLGELPDVLDGRVDELQVTLPWGSLLRSVVSAEPAFIGRSAALLCPGGQLLVLVSLTERDRSPGLPVVQRDTVGLVVGRYGGDGLDVVEARQATEADVADLGSAWAKRLGIPRRREAFLIRARKR